MEDRKNSLAQYLVSAHLKMCVLGIGNEKVVWVLCIITLVASYTERILKTRETMAPMASATRQ